MLERKSGFADLLSFLIIFLLSLTFQNLLFGIVILFFIPGYLFLQVMYKDELKSVLSIIFPLSIGMSAVVVGIVGLLHFYFIGERFSVLISLWVVIGLLGVLVFIQRVHLGETKRIGNSIFPKISIGAWGIVKVISLIVVFISFGYYYWLTISQQPEFTEFYILGADGLSTGYPTEVTENSPINITVGVVNHEGKIQNYSIVGLVGDEPIGALYPFEVPDNERREGEITLVFPRAGDNQRVDILLGGDGLEYPYRHLTLWVNVLGEDQESN